MTPEQSLLELRKELASYPRIAKLLSDVATDQEIKHLRKSYDTFDHAGLLTNRAMAQAISEFVKHITAPSKSVK